MTIKGNVKERSCVSELCHKKAASSRTSVHKALLTPQQAGLETYQMRVGGKKAIDGPPYLFRARKSLSRLRNTGLEAFIVQVLSQNCQPSGEDVSQPREKTYFEKELGIGLCEFCAYCRHDLFLLV